MNHENYCSYELSKKLKDKGYEGESEYIWFTSKATPVIIWEQFIENTSISSKYNIKAVTLYHAHKWLRDKGIFIEVFPNYIDKENKWSYLLSYSNGDNFGRLILKQKPEDLIPFDTFEEALSSGINKALELI